MVQRTKFIDQTQEDCLIFWKILPLEWSGKLKSLWPSVSRQSMSTRTNSPQSSSLSDDTISFTQKD